MSISSLEYLAGPAADVADADSYAVFRSRLPFEEMVRLFDYWLGLVEANGLVVKSLVDPLAIPDLLPNLYYEEWDHSSGQSKIRLAGEALRDMWGGASFLGATIDQQMQGKTNDLWKRCDQANFQDQAPTLCCYNLQHRGRGYRWVWDLSLPVADRAGNRFVFGIVLPSDAEMTGIEEGVRNEP